jgi:hypothetical protein
MTQPLQDDYEECAGPGGRGDGAEGRGTLAELGWTFCEVNVSDVAVIDTQSREMTHSNRWR